MQLQITVKVQLYFIICEIVRKRFSQLKRYNFNIIECILTSSIGQRNEAVGHLRIVGGDGEEYAYVAACRRGIAKSSYSGETLATADE